MMDFAKYEVKMELPKLGFKPVLSNFSPSVEEVEEYKKKLEKYEKRKKEYKEKVKEYRAEKQRLIEQFKKDAFKELGIENFPEVVKEKVFEIAWEEGHSEGFYRVYEKMEVLVDFLKTFKKECKRKKKCERRCKMKMVDYKLMDGINDTLKEEKRYMAEIYRPLNAISMLEEEEVRKVYEKEMKENEGRREK